MKKLKLNLSIFIMLGMIFIFSTTTEALSPPYLYLNTSQDVITSDNAVLHAALINTGQKIKGFEIFIYKDSVLVKSGFKESSSEDSAIDSVIAIEFDLKKDLAIELLPQTTYTYTIRVRIDENVNQDMYKQSFHFTTTSVNNDVPKATTVAPEEQTTKEKVNTTVKKPSIVKYKSVKLGKQKSVVVKYKKALNTKKYQIQYSTSRKFKKATIKTTKKCTYSIRKLKKGETYYIRVRGVNGTKKGNWSIIKKVTIK